MRTERIEQIMDLLRERGDEVRLDELKELMPGLSESTLRRDLGLLEEEGRVIRTYGGVRLAALLPEGDVLRRRDERLPLKRLAAKAALAQITPEHHVIYLDAGTTCACLAEILPAGGRMVVTNDPHIALKVARKPGVRAMLLGGTINPPTFSVVGRWSLDQLSSLHIELAFMGASGMAADTGFTNLNAEECDLKKDVIARARRTVVVCDSGKFNRIFPFTFADFDRVGALASDARPTGGLAESAARAGLACLVPGPDSPGRP